MSRVIIEGMDPDDTVLNYVTYEFDINPEASLLLFEFYNYRLDLVGRFNKGGCFRKAKKGKITLEQELTYPFPAVGVPESPQTVIVEDGRVYSHTSKERLRHTLRALQGITFDFAYEQIREHPERFYRGAVEIKRVKGEVVITPL